MDQIDNCADIHTIASLMQDRILRNMSQQMNVSKSSIKTMKDSLDPIISNWLQLITKSNHAAIQLACEMLPVLMKQSWNVKFDAELLVPSPIDDGFVDSVTQAVPYLSHESQEKYGEDFLPQLQAVVKKNLTVPNAIALINLLVVIFFGIIQSTPSKQLEKLGEQNDIIIEQNNDIIENQENIIAHIPVLSSALDNLTDAIHLLVDKIEPIYDELKSSNETIDSYTHSDAKDGQQQNPDAQD